MGIASRLRYRFCGVLVNCHSTETLNTHTLVTDKFKCDTLSEIDSGLQRDTETWGGNTLQITAQLMYNFYHVSDLFNVPYKI